MRVYLDKTSCILECYIRNFAEMNTNDAKEYLARREIPQLFEVRGIDCEQLLTECIVNLGSVTV